MKKTILSLTLMSFFLATNAQNVITEGFESQDLKGWNVWNTMSNVKIEHDNVRSGNNALMVNGGMDKDVILTPGKYELEFYTSNLIGNGGKIILREKESDKSWKYLDFQSYDFPTAKSYTKGCLKFKIKKENKFKIVVTSPHNAKYMLDDVKLEKK